MVNSIAGVSRVDKEIWNSDGIPIRVSILEGC